MFKKRAQFKCIEATPLNVPHLRDGFVIDQHLQVNAEEVNQLTKKIAAQVEATHNIESTHDKEGVPDVVSFNLEAEIQSHPDSLFVKCFAIKADEMNDNGDLFGHDELKKATPTFIGVPIFTNHNNTDAEAARGKVVHSWWDENRNGIMIIARVDSEAYPQLSRGIKEEYIMGTSMGCFTPECRVLLSDGTYLPISDVQPGDHVYTHLGNIKEVLNTQTRYKNEMLFEIAYEGIGSSLEVTKNHPILTLKTYNKCACGCGGKLPIPKKNSTRFNNWKNKYRKRFLNGHSQYIWNTNKFSKTHSNENKKKIQKSRTYTQDDFAWKKVSNLREGDVVVFPTNYKKSRKKQPTIKQSKLIGYFLAEGSYKKYNEVRKEVNFSFCYSKEKDTFVVEVINLLKDCFGKNISIWTQHRYPTNDVIIVCCHNEKVAKWFYKYCGEYSTKKALPNEFTSWSLNVQKTIIGAFINGDGCNSTKIRKSPVSGKITPYTEISINTSSQKLAEQFSVSLSRCKIWHTFHAIHGRKSVELKKCSGLDRWIETRLVKGQESLFRTKPAYSIVLNQNYCSMIYPFTRKNLKILYNKTETFKEQNDLLIAGPYLCRKIKEINPFVYTGPVYNLQVQGDNSYIVEGATVKNCQVKYSICSICHNVAESPQQYCAHIKERKTRNISANKVKCEYHKYGNDEFCPLCSSTKKDKKTFAVKDQDVFEYNYGIKFIENSFVTNPACHDCGVKEVIDPSKFLAKVAEIETILPSLLKMAQETDVICTDQGCIRLANTAHVDVIQQALDFLNKGAKYIEKVAGQEQINDLNQALNLLTSVSQDMLQQKDQIDLEFLSDLVKVLADLQTVTDELTEQGYGRLPSIGTTQQTPDQGSVQPTQPTQAVPSAPSATGGASKIHSGPAGNVGTVTSPTASKKFDLKKLVS